MRRQAWTAGLVSKTRRSANAPICRTTPASKAFKTWSVMPTIVRNQEGVRSIAARISSDCNGLSGDGRMGAERMIARNSNKMSERSS